MSVKLLRFKPTCFAGTTDATAEVISNPEAIANFTPTFGGSTKVINVALHDSNDNASEALSVYFFAKGDNDLTPTLGTAVSMTDANFLANIPFASVALSGVAAGAHGDLISSKLYNADTSFVVQSEEGSRDIFVSIVADSTGFVSTADGLELIISVED